MTERLFILVGINDCDRPPPLSTVEEITRFSRMLGLKLVFVEIPTPPELPLSVKENIRCINHMLRCKGDFFIPPLPEKHVKITSKDQFRIHHDERTVRAVMADVLEFEDRAFSSGRRRR